MSIDTYDTLAMVLSTASGRYDLDWMEGLARGVCGSGAMVSRELNEIGHAYLSLQRDGTELRIYYSEEPHVLTESDEIAEDCGGLCRGSAQRFELLGTDLELVLMNDHQRLCEYLHATGDFILYSGQAGLLFEDVA